ncbi:glycosyltransferase [Mangrovimonas sp. YM274]|uniref:glycosyltransferase family 2 protein n=1 Tax=Mangrovimonas sp. YM274 TaxID=3070660 RepID=UPI0027DDD2D5|nr:glycosyltransferase [Mangrovimonas sp. YM274]WMI69845.1 glycosyltransferase [Mangrovimonas sp. YM274]
MKIPLTSIIIPTFNREDLIKKALDSVISQTNKNWECIVVDDGSTDNTLKVLEEYTKRDKRIQWFKRDRGPKGAPTCRNIGLEKANGDYVIYLDSDDFLMPYCLEQRVNAAIAFPNNDFWVFPTSLLEEGVLKKQNLELLENYLIGFLSSNLPWTIVNPFWRKEILLQLKGFTEGYPRFNDPELMIRALLLPKIKYKILNNAKPDTVLEPSPKSSGSFYKKVYQGLNLFIPDTVKHLEEAGKTEKTKHLVMYLWLWIKYYYAPNPSGKFIKSVKLIRSFYRLSILTSRKSLSLGARLLHFHLTRTLHLAHTDKLTNKGYFT